VVVDGFLVKNPKPSWTSLRYSEMFAGLGFEPHIGLAFYVFIVHFLKLII
jgi:hypothetical protein